QAGDELLWRCLERRRFGGLVVGRAARRALRVGNGGSGRWRGHGVFLRGPDALDILSGRRFTRRQHGMAPQSTGIASESGFAASGLTFSMLWRSSRPRMNLASRAQVSSDWS